ncbi:MAG: SAM-dependent chlorinase/fluorinase [Flavobacteriaceae bacterium]|jgi:S-adenosylmethionine hydrolase|nr:SAM-dependent chlorinase/fluorinase [Flavobacteriaceae bacterium]
MQRIITLTTDFGYKDYYVGALKGKLYSNIENCNIVDISHGIKDYNIEEAGFVLKSTFEHYPLGTIHIVSVSAFISEDTPVTCMYFRGHFFIATDNGVLGLILGDETFTEATHIVSKEEIHINDAFVFCAARIFDGQVLSEFGQAIDTVYRLNSWSDSLTVEKNRIIGKIIYEDTYGNLITNIPMELFHRELNDRKYIIRVKDRSISKINKYFAEVKPTDTFMRHERAGDFVALFNDLNLLTLAIVFSKPNEPGGSPRTLINLRVSDTVSIEFED